MKRIIVIMIAICAACFTVGASKPKQKATVRTVVYVTDLECESCAKKIKENVSFDKGVKDLAVDVKSRTVLIKFDESKNDTLSLRKSLNKLGYAAMAVSYE